MAILVCLLYVQVWPDIGGFTVRMEDILMIAMWAAVLSRGCLTGRLHFRRDPLDGPILSCILALAVGVVASLAWPYDSETHKDAIVNGTRLILACSVFLLVRLWPGSARQKWWLFVRAVLGVSVLTTIVSLAQIAYWDGWLPLTLPSWLIEFKPGANTTRGREIFALFVGDTGAHTWAGMLALQALLVWLLAWHVRLRGQRIALLVYFVILALILVRISVRNSIVGLALAALSLVILKPVRYRRPAEFPVRSLLLLLLAMVLLMAVLTIAPESYFVERVLQAIPRLEDGRLVVSRGSNIYGRIDYAIAAWRMFCAHPLLGVGFYGYQPQSVKYLGDSVVHAHNSYLQTMAELGVLGFSALVWLGYRLGRRLTLVWRDAMRARETRLVWSMTTGVALFLAITAFFSNPLWGPQYVAMMAYTASILVEFSRKP